MFQPYLCYNSFSPVIWQVLSSCPISRKSEVHVQLEGEHGREELHWAAEQFSGDLKWEGSIHRQVIVTSVQLSVERRPVVGSSSLQGGGRPDKFIQLSADRRPTVGSSSPQTGPPDFCQSLAEFGVFMTRQTGKQAHNALHAAFLPDLASICRSVWFPLYR